MPKPVRIQLAVQGGGARLVSLLAAFEAIAELEKEGELSVTRIAATSAGAIAAALFAAGTSMETVKTHLQGKAEKLTREYTTPSTIRKLFAAATNRPFWDVSELKSSLLTLFESKTTLGDLGDKKLSIIATDLKNLRKVVRSKPSDPLVDSLLDSCAIPLFFRSASTAKDGAALIVDGGICANLPAEELVENEEHGQVIGLSFETSLLPTNPTGLIGFAETMLNTAIEHSVLRARSELRERLLSLKTEITTFSFDRALTEGLTTEWSNCYTQARTFFMKYIQNRLEQERHNEEDKLNRQREATEEAERAARDAERQRMVHDTLRSVRRTVHDVYENQEAPKLFAYERISLTVSAYSLLRDTNIQPDTVVRKSLFRPAADVVYAHLASTITHIDEQPVSDDFRVLDKDGNDLAIDRVDLEPEYLHIDEIASIRYRKIIYFRDPLRVGDDRAPFQLLTFERFTGTVGKLRNGGEDWVSIKASRVAGHVPLVDVVIHLPKSYSGAKLISGGVRDEQGTWVDFHPGKDLPRNVLNMEYPAPPGFYALGLRGTNLPAGTRFGCKINVSKGAVHA